MTAALGLLMACPAMAQFTYGTTGLLHMPTADMQPDKTFMFGGGRLNKEATPSRWSYDTWNYYVNVTFLPFLEVGYTCTIFDEWTHGGKLHMKNQDRSFHGRLRLWKEGWWKDWTTVSINLREHDGEEVVVRLTTYDCAELGHFGYAYFTLDCSDGQIQSSACGDVEKDTLIGPDGFKYRWYKKSEPRKQACLSFPNIVLLDD